MNQITEGPAGTLSLNGKSADIEPLYANEGDWYPQSYRVTLKDAHGLILRVESFNTERGALRVVDNHLKGRP